MEPTSADLPFCGDVVSYSACLQPTNPLWPNWNSAAKDALVERLFNSAVSSRKTAEQASLSNGGTNGTYMSLLFTGNDACVSQYKKSLCLYNFPECVESKKEVSVLGFNVSPILGICSQSCMNFFTTCKFDAAVAEELCQASWPLGGDYSSALASSSSMLVDQSQDECTGKSSERFGQPIVILLISLLVLAGQL